MFHDDDRVSPFDQRVECRQQLVDVVEMTENPLAILSLYECPLSSNPTGVTFERSQDNSTCSGISDCKNIVDF